MPTIILHREKNAKFGLDFYPSDLRLILVSIRSNGLYEIYKKMRSANDCFMPNMPKFSVVQSTYLSKLVGAVKKMGIKSSTMHWSMLLIFGAKVHYRSTDVS